MWYWWTKVNRADIPQRLLTEFEQYGEAVVAQILGRPYTHGLPTIGVPIWAASAEDRQFGLLWLRQKHNEADRRHDVNEAMEVAIVFLVAIEAIPTLYGWITWLVAWCCGPHSAGYWHTSLE
jgi:hypothetical protein